MKKFCKLLRECAMKIINLKNEVINKKAAGIIWKYKHLLYLHKKKFENKFLENKKYCKVRNHCQYTRKCRGAAHSICDLKYSIPKIISIVFHNGSIYDYHCIIIELAEEFKKLFTFTYLGGNTEKYINFTGIYKKLQELLNIEEKLYILHITIH